MDLVEVSSTVQNAILNSALFPYRTGNLRDNFIDYGSEVSNGNEYSFSVLSSPMLIKSSKGVNYGKLLEERASIRYRTKNHIIRHKNTHFRYIERIIDNDVIDAIQIEYGVKRI